MLKIIAKAAVLAGKAPGLVVQYYRQRRVGARTFRQELLRAGMPSESANELAQCYEKMFVPEWKQLFRR